MEYLERNKLVVAENAGDTGSIEVGDTPLLLGIDIFSAFDCLSRNKLLRLLEQLKLSHYSIDLIVNTQPEP